VGSIIGKGGVTVNDIMRQSQTKVHVSKPSEVFPGTRERVCTILGNGRGMESILVGLHLILTKIRAEDSTHEFQFKLIMPAQGCGAVIGKRGANIRAIIDETGAELKMSDKNQMSQTAPFRLITIFGTVDQQIRTVALCVLRATEESEYLRSIRGFNGTSAEHSHADYMQPLPDSFRGPEQFMHGNFGGFPGQSNAFTTFGLSPHLSSPLPELPRVLASLTSTCTLLVPNECVGCLIGKGGSTISSVMAQTGTKIKVSEREKVSREDQRSITISGPEPMVIRAFQLFCNILLENERSIRR